MKILVFILFPVYLFSQNYRLDSLRYDGPTRGYVDKYYYHDEDNYERHHTSYDSDGIEYRSIHFFEDSLEIKKVINQGGDSIIQYFEFDDLRRLIRETDFIKGSIRYEYKSDYYFDTGLQSKEEFLSFKNEDTSRYILEITEYDSLLREVYYFDYFENADTFYKSSEGWTDYVHDSVSYSTSIYSQELGVLDTTYTKSVYFPNQYFGDTLRTWRKFFWVTKDSIVLNSDEQVKFMWGDHNRYENSGIWTYLHGIIYGSYIEYEPITGGFAFTAYESGWPEGDPINWKEDIEKYDYLIFEGTVKINEHGFPIEQIIFHDSGTSLTRWYYSELTLTHEPIERLADSTRCRIIRDLAEDSFYFDITGKRVYSSSGSQYLFEMKNKKLERILFIND